MANDFLPFSTSGTANVYTNAEYIADTDHTNGNQPGIAKSKLVNKALRQASIISTVVSQFIADITGTNAVDDGTTATLLANLKLSTKGMIGANIASATTTTVGGYSSGDVINITGTTTVAGLGVAATGIKKTLIFNGILTLTHNAASLILPGGANITTSAGSVGMFVCIDGALGYWKCVGYTDNLTNKASLLNAPNITNGFTLDGAVPNYGKNYIINGNFDVWQYATTQITTGYGSDDRWSNNNVGSTKTHSQVASTDTERALFNSSKFSRTVVTSSAGVGNYCDKLQRIENVTKLAGKIVTISFWAKADTTKNIAIEFQQLFGTGGTPSAGVTGIGSQLVALTSTWQKKTITVTMPSIIGKTLGTDGVHTSFSQLTFWFDAGSNYNLNTASLGQQSGTFDIAEVQLEEGSVATPWSPYNGEFGGEVQACQRYLPRINYAINNAVGAGNIYTATIGLVNIKFPTTTRVPPTGAVFSSATLLTWVAGGGDYTSTVLSLYVTSTNESANIQGAISGATLGQGAVVRASAAGYIYFTGCEL